MNGKLYRRFMWEIIYLKPQQRNLFLANNFLYFTVIGVMHVNQLFNTSRNWKISIFEWADKISLPQIFGEFYALCD